MTHGWMDRSCAQCTIVINVSHTFSFYESLSFVKLFTVQFFFEGHKSFEKSPILFDVNLVRKFNVQSVMNVSYTFSFDGMF